MPSIVPRLRGRPAHPPGPTFLSYTPNGRRLVTAGSNSSVRIYTSGSDGEPTNVDDCQEQNAAVVASNNFFITGAEDGTVCMYSMETNSMDKMLVRCTLPIRDIALSPDTNWAAVASDELTVKIVNTQDMYRVMHLREQPKAVKHVSWDPTGSFVTVSCSDGIVYLYSVSTEEPVLARKIDGVIRKLDPDEEPTSKAVWHPDGRAFAAATATKDIVVVSKDDGERQRSFSGGHNGDITALAWSPNGALLASAGTDGKIVLWETKSQQTIAKYDYQNVANLAWHPTDNMISFTTMDGELFIFPDFIPEEHAHLLEKSLHAAPFIHDPAEESNGIARNLVNGLKQRRDGSRNIPRDSPDSLDEILSFDDEDGNFVEDDDGAGYAMVTNGRGKRTNGHLDELNGHDRKRFAGGFGPLQLDPHPSFQPGSTPWRGNRRYLCLNLTGVVWTVDQDTHNTITVEFYDREYYRDFHFTDPYLYDKACLNENGALFSAPPNPATSQPSTIFYRPHEHWTSSRPDWRATLPEEEDIIAIALSTSYITVATTSYLRTYTLFGVPIRITRPKSTPIVTLTSFRDYLLTVSAGPIPSIGHPSLTYTLENLRRDTVHQSLDVLPLPPLGSLKSIFFSSAGDPYIYDSTGVLLVLLHWRDPGRARWVPVLDTTQLSRLASGRKQESYFAIAVADNKFHCIILKGGDQYPYFPRPLLSEFDFHVPITSLPRNPHNTNHSHPDDGGTDQDNLDEVAKFEQSYLQTSILHSLLSATLEHSTTTTRTRPPSAPDQSAALTTLVVTANKTLLQLLAAECRNGEEKGMKGLEIVRLLTDGGRDGKMVQAAEKVAERFGRHVLAEKVREWGEERLMMMDRFDEDGDGVDDEL